jgi:hypothetical protein
MVDQKKPLPKTLLILSAGFLSAILVYRSYNLYIAGKSSSPDDRVLTFNPYQYQKKTKASAQYFYASLPKSVQISIQSRNMNYDYLTSCEGNLIPELQSNFAVAFFSGDKPHLYIFEPGSHDSIRNTFDLSENMTAKKMTADDYLEIHCAKAARILKAPLFQGEKMALKQIEFLKKTDQDVIQVKAQSSHTYELFAYNSVQASFQKIGTLDTP